jgi:Domain of unknown function (DUF4157)
MLTHAPPISRLPTASWAPAVQPKLTIGAPDDRYEKEADRVADQVMRKPLDEPVATAPPAIQRKCAACEEEELQRAPLEEPEHEERIDAKAQPGAAPVAGPAATAQVRALAGGGRPLPHGEQRFFGHQLGHDFGGVRVHADARAAEAAAAVRARAFTWGRDVVFGAGEYAPSTSRGRHLLAHELTHVIQQGRAPRHDR